MSQRGGGKLGGGYRCSSQRVGRIAPRSRTWNKEVRFIQANEEEREEYISTNSSLQLCPGVFENQKKTQAGLLCDGFEESCVSKI